MKFNTIDDLKAAGFEGPRQPRSVGVLQMDEAATVCRDRQDSVSSYNLI